MQSVGTMVSRQSCLGVFIVQSLIICRQFCKSFAMPCLSGPDVLSEKGCSDMCRGWPCPGHLPAKSCLWAQALGAGMPLVCDGQLSHLVTPRTSPGHSS